LHVYNHILTFLLSGVCLFVSVFVCQHDNFRTIKHRTTKLGG